MTENLDHLVARLHQLDAEPVANHPGVLDELHRGLVGELDRLAGVVAGDGAGQSSGSTRR
jgi:hypothetical protein